MRSFYYNEVKKFTAPENYAECRCFFSTFFVVACIKELCDDENYFNLFRFHLLNVLNIRPCTQNEHVQSSIMTALTEMQLHRFTQSRKCKQHETLISHAEDIKNS